MQNLTITYSPVSDLTANARNTRTHDKRQLRQIRNSIEAFGFTNPLLVDEAGGSGAAEAPILEEGSEGVRIMTVHKAKGLEFPVVVLADISASLARTTAGPQEEQPSLARAQVDQQIDHLLPKPALHQHDRN